MKTLELGSSIAALRAMLLDDFDGYSRLRTQIDRSGEKRNYVLLLGAAFLEAMDRHFGDHHTRSDVIEFVGRVRAWYSQAGEDVDPEAAENLILAALGDEDPRADINGRTRGAAQVAVLYTAIQDEQLSDDELDAFLNDAARRAAEWAERKQQ